MCFTPALMSSTRYQRGVANAGAFLLIGAVELQIYMVADRMCARFDYAVARIVLQAFFCWIVGWQLMNRVVIGFIAAESKEAVKRVGSAAGASRRRSSPAAKGVNIAVTTRTTPAAAPLSPLATFLVRKRASIISSRLADTGACHFAPMSATLEWTFEQVLEAQRQKLRPPNDPLNPSIMRVTLVSEGERVDSDVRIRERVREIDSSIIEWVPSMLRGMLPARAADGIKLREYLTHVPDARFASVFLTSVTCGDYVVLQVSRVALASPHFWE